jgi:hypothetical protein
LLQGGIEDLRFEGEGGTGPGVVAEWFQQVGRYISDPANGIFGPRTEEAPHYMQIPHSGASANRTALRNTYTAVGRFLGLALLHETPVPVQFPLSLYARLGNLRVELEDIRTDEPMMYNSLSYLLTASSADLVDMELTIQGVTHQVRLDNRRALIENKLRAIYSEHEHELVDAIRAGFHTVFPVMYGERFGGAANWRAAIQAETVVDVEDLIAHLRFANGYSANSAQAGWLIQELRELSQNRLVAFMRFVTSASAPPAGGFGYMPPITVDAQGEANELPRSSTCQTTLHLPRYATRSDLRRALWLALSSELSFDSF